MLLYLLPAVAFAALPLKTTTTIIVISSNSCIGPVGVNQCRVEY